MRHIPSSDTFHAGVLTFEEALIPSANDYDRDRWIYVPDHYSEYRYILGTKGSRPLVCIGINPSTAAPDRLDNTLKSAQRIALFNGYDSFIMFNVYAQRATIPDVEAEFDKPYFRSLFRMGRLGIADHETDVSARMRTGYGRHRQPLRRTLVHGRSPEQSRPSASPAVSSERFCPGSFFRSQLLSGYPHPLTFLFSGGSRHDEDIHRNLYAVIP